MPQLQANLDLDILRLIHCTVARIQVRSGWIRWMPQTTLQCNADVKILIVHFAIWWPVYKCLHNYYVNKQPTTTTNYLHNRLCSLHVLLKVVVLVMITQHNISSSHMSLVWTSCWQRKKSIKDNWIPIDMRHEFTCFNGQTIYSTST